MERAYWLAWSQIPRIGPITIKKIHQQFQTLETAWNASTTQLATCPGLGKDTIETIVRERSQINPLQLLENHPSNFWTPLDPEYPQLLLEIPSPPPILYYLGQTELIKSLDTIPCIGIVGTRHPTEYGKRWTTRISKALTQAGFIIVSGMAQGIDTFAHQGCLDQKGKTIAILGTGIDIVYPNSNKRLYQEIQIDGLILSEYPPGTQPKKEHFPPRNRIIAGLARAILIMEAPVKSGSLITANYGNDFGRDIYILPHSLDNPQSKGGMELINKGAGIILSEEQLLEQLGIIPQLDQPSPQTPIQLSLFTPDPIPISLAPELEKILQIIPKEPTSLDTIIAESGLNSSKVTAGLLELELMGLIEQKPGMRYINCHIS